MYKFLVVEITFNVHILHILYASTQYWWVHYFYPSICYVEKYISKSLQTIDVLVRWKILIFCTDKYIEIIFINIKIKSKQKSSTIVNFSETN